VAAGEGVRGFQEGGINRQTEFLNDSRGKDARGSRAARSRGGSTLESPAPARNWTQGPGR
jgi:hypothetical protein